MNIYRVTLKHNKELIVYFLFYNGLTRGILSTPRSVVYRIIIIIIKYLYSAYTFQF